VFGQIMAHRVEYADLTPLRSGESWSLEEGIVKSAASTSTGRRRRG
jgi:hypothetical protein